ncbi:unnamed protein product [Gadus morhua 'NCC']
MPHVDILYQQLQQKDIDAVLIQQALQRFTSSVQAIRGSPSLQQLTPQYKIQSALRRRHDALPGTSLQGFISALYFEPGRRCSPFTGPLWVQKGPFAEVCVKVDRRPDQKSEHERRRRRRVRPVSPPWVPVTNPPLDLCRCSSDSDRWDRPAAV